MIKGWEDETEQRQLELKKIDEETILVTEIKVLIDENGKKTEKRYEEYALPIYEVGYNMGYDDPDKNPWFKRDCVYRIDNKVIIKEAWAYTGHIGSYEDKKSIEKHKEAVEKIKKGYYFYNGTSDRIKEKDLSIKSGSQLTLNTGDPEDNFGTTFLSEKEAVEFAKKIIKEGSPREQNDKAVEKALDFVEVYEPSKDEKEELFNLKIKLKSHNDIHYNSKGEQIYEQVKVSNHNVIYEGWGQSIFENEGIICAVYNSGGVHALPKKLSAELLKARWAENDNEDRSMSYSGELVAFPNKAFKDYGVIIPKENIEWLEDNKSK